MWLARGEEAFMDFIMDLLNHYIVSFRCALAENMLTVYYLLSNHGLISKLGKINFVLNCPVVNWDVFDIVINICGRCAIIIISCCIFASLYLKHYSSRFHSSMISFKFQIKWIALARTNEVIAFPCVEKVNARLICSKVFGNTLDCGELFVVVLMLFVVSVVMNCLIEPRLNVTL